MGIKYLSATLKNEWERPVGATGQCLFNFGGPICHGLGAFGT